jgi:biotin carboxylase
MRTSKKMLIGGGGYAEIPLIRAAKRQGYHVITTGNRPEDLGHRYADEYHMEDFSDCEAIAALGKKLGIEAIVPGCNDFSAISCAYTAEKMNLPGHDSFQTCQTLHHKDRYRSFAERNQVRTPSAEMFTNADDAISCSYGRTLPLMVKPVDLTGGKGIHKITQKREIEDCVHNALNSSRAKRIVIEEFVDGSHHGFSSFIRDGKLAFYFIDNEYYFVNQYLVSGASTPSLITEQAELDICQQMEKIARELNLKDGLMHAQFILQGERPVIIEICRRPPGDLYIDLVRHATDLNYADWIVRGFSGQDCSKLRQEPIKNYTLRHCIMGRAKGTLKEVVYHDQIRDNIVDQYVWYKRGDKVENELVHKHGIVFLQFESLEEMHYKSKRMQNLIEVVVE